MNTLKRMIATAIFCAAAHGAEFPCKLENYKIPKTDQLHIECPSGFSAITGTAQLFLVLDDSVSGTALSAGKLRRSDFNWIGIDFEKAMDSGKDYEVRLQGKITTQGEEIPFEKRFRYTTSSSAKLSLPKTVAQTAYTYGQELWINSAIELAPDSPPTLSIESEDAPGVFVPHSAAFEMDRTPSGSMVLVGRAKLTFREVDSPNRLDARFRTTGLRDIFGQAVAISSKRRLAPPGAPKSKEDSFYYAKILHQAGVDSRPAWILDGKLAPVFTIRKLANWQFRPTVEADIGQGGAIGKTKTNDYIMAGAGIGRFVRTEKFGPLQGIDPTFGAAYETNYAGDKKNILFVPEAKFYLAGTDHSLKQKNFNYFVHQSQCAPPLPGQMTVEQCKKNPPVVEPQDAIKARFGYKFRVSGGLELGKQISEQLAEAFEGDSTVNVPGYRIARVRPTAELDLEFWRITLTLSGTPRYLATTENVYRERDVAAAGGTTKKEVYLDRVKGWRPSGEATLSLPLDDAGHYALTSSLKLGSLPPNFQRVAIVQSGITIKF